MPLATESRKSHNGFPFLYAKLNSPLDNDDIGVIVSNERDRNGKKLRKQMEIDFVCNKGSKRYYIQSAFAMSDGKKKKQEQRSLLMTGDGFKKIIITKDALAPLYNEEGILIRGVLEFLY